MRKRIVIIACIVICFVITFIPINEINSMDNISSKVKNINLLGETHSDTKSYNKEIELWKEYYEKGDRYLFVELPYYTAEYINLWMESPNNDILNDIY